MEPPLDHSVDDIIPVRVDEKQLVEELLRCASSNKVLKYSCSAEVTFTKQLGMQQFVFRKMLMETT